MSLKALQDDRLFADHEMGLGLGQVKSLYEVSGVESRVLPPSCIGEGFSTFGIVCLSHVFFIWFKGFGLMMFWGI